MEKISQPPQEYRSFMSVRELTISGLLAGLTGGDRVSGERDELAKHLL